MVHYIAKNKVFVFLLVCLLLINALLIMQATGANTIGMYNEPSIYTPHATTFKLDGDFDEKEREVILSWTLPNSRENVKDMILYYNDKQIEDVTNRYSIQLPLNQYEINTGNPNFKLIVTYEDGTVLDKEIYVHIDGVFDIHVSSQLNEGKVIYNITYWYAKNNPSSVPRLNYNSDMRFDIAYQESKVLAEDGAYEQTMATYELQLNDIPSGNYQIDMEWSFIDFDNISYPYQSNFEVKGANNENH